MFFLDQILSDTNGSGIVRIDLPKPANWEMRKKPSAKGIFGGATIGGVGGGVAGGLIGDLVGGVIGAYTAGPGGAVIGRTIGRQIFSKIGVGIGGVGGGLIGGANVTKDYKVATDYDYISIIGICPDDFTISLGNNWGSILPESILREYTRVSQMTNEGNILTWLSGSRAAWKGCKPITFPITFYVFSLMADYDCTDVIEPLLEYASVSQSSGGFVDVDILGLQSEGVHAHGGYRVQAFDNNQKYIDMSADTRSDNSTIRLYFGDNIFIDNLLLSDIRVTHSTIRVRSGAPLYVKVEAQFRTVGVPTEFDIRRIYGMYQGR